MFLLIALAAGLSTAATASTYALSVSSQANRSGAVALNGSTLNGSVYIFTSMASQMTNSGPSGISRVCFWIDNTAMSSAAMHCESISPYDFAGSNDSTGGANAWNANSVANGTHTITQQVTMTTGAVEVDSASFTVGTSASPNGTTIPSATRIVDSQNAVWTVSGGLIYRNGTQLPSDSVILLLYYNGVVYQENNWKDWWAWMNGTWSPSSDPRTAASATPTVTAPSVTTTSLPGAKQNTAYSTTLAGSGGTTPYTWSLAGGSLPSGVSLSSTGTISGTPATSGSFAISVKLTDATGKTASANETLSVAAAPSSGTYALSYSTNANRSGGMGLNGATLSGNEYIFTSSASQLSNYNPSGITQVCYWLDNTAMSGAATHCEGIGPYDFAGSGSTTANPWTTSSVANGTHTITEKVTLSTGATEVDMAAFKVNNTATPSTAPTSSSSTGNKFFGPSSFINTPLPSNPPIDSNSASMVQNSLVAQASAAHLSNGDYGVGLVYSSASDKVYSVACTIYDSNTCLVGSSINFPIPKGATPPAGTDHNTAFIYTANDGSPYAGMELDCWVAQYNSSNDTWSCGTASLVKNNNTNAWGTCAESNITSYHCNGGYAAGFDFAAGPIRPEEIAAGQINHALVIALSNTGSGITCPATHTDHSGNGIPEGGHFFLPASYNVDAQSWPAWVKTVAKALQHYGGYIVDYGGSFEIKGFSDKNPGSLSWASVGVPVDGWSNLAQIPWDQMQVVSMQSCN